MCFSAAASFIAGGSIGTIGIATVKKNNTKEALPLAIIPFLFAIQQSIEGLVWLTAFNSPVFYWIAIYAYMIFSHVLWPIWVPLAIMIIEKDLTRKKILKLFLMIGIIVGAYFLFLIIKGPITAQILDNGIRYSLDYQYGYFMAILYLLASCISCLFSTHRLLKLFGITLMISFMAAFQISKTTLFSVWCFFAAFLSIIIYLHFRIEAVQSKAAAYVKAIL